MTKKKKEKEEFLENEIIEKSLSPHPLSFMKLQSLCLFLIIWGVILGWLVNFSEYKTLFNGNEWFILLAWGFFFVEIYRRSHHYIITNLRIVLMSGFLTKTELSIRYDKITVFGKQSVLGQIFNFGTIIPITQSGLGLGSDQTLAAGGLMLGGKKAKLLGLAGGGKEVQTPRSRSSFELHGVHPYRETKNSIEKLVQESVPTAYHQKQGTLKETEKIEEENDEENEEEDVEEKS